MRPREQLGRELRSRRLLAGFSGPHLAEIIGTTQSKISRTETAKFRPDIDMVQRWIDATGTESDDQRRILRLAEEATTEVAEYRTLFRGSLLTGQTSLIGQDQAAASIRHFQPFQIPGPLHTPQYARNALLAGRMDDETGLEEAVMARLERGINLTRPGSSSYHVILTEPALLYRPWGVTDDDQRGAWARVLEYSEAASIEIQVVPLIQAFRQAPMCAFVATAFRDPTRCAIVQVELPAVEMTFSGSADLEAFDRTWNCMLEVALSPEKSRNAIQSLLKN
jgi:transcriptional regulator with XRE-family HTH domain